MRLKTLGTTTFAAAALAAALAAATLTGCARDNHGMCGNGMGMGMRGMNGMQGMQGVQQNNAALQAQPASDQRVSPSQQVAPGSFSTTPAAQQVGAPLGSCNGR